MSPTAAEFSRPIFPPDSDDCGYKVPLSELFEGLNVDGHSRKENQTCHVDFEFCSGTTDKPKKKTKGKARQRAQTKPDKTQVCFKSPMDSSLFGNATENVTCSSATEKMEEKVSANDDKPSRDRPRKKYKLKVGKTRAQESAEWESEGLYAECERWRMRGNRAYKNGDMAKAEEFYTNGINCVKEKNIEESSISLVMCYNNRAATRMSHGSLREALEDCIFAATEHPAFLKAKLRAANCHLLLGELGEAIQYYRDCLEDTRIVTDAREGLQKAQLVSDSLCNSANILQQGTSDAASSALKEINKGLSISCYSERLLEMRGQSLFLLRRYDEVIDLCEQTLGTAEKNFRNSRQWRWCLIFKCRFHLGRFDAAMDAIERLESSTPLADTVRELVRRKEAGNKAFQCGKHSEAVQHYTAAISGSLEFDLHPFAAICYCNRAAAHQALGAVADAISDCSVAIALDGDHVKAVSRRAALHESVRDYKQAITDLRKALPLVEKCAQLELKRRVSLMEEKARKEEAPMDLYLILGIKACDSEGDVKRAYKRAALKHHPDKACQYLARLKSGEIVEKVHEDAERLFKMIGEAYAVLSDADKRSNYDFDEEIRNCVSRSSASDYHYSPYERHGYPNPSSRRYWKESSWAS